MEEDNSKFEIILPDGKVYRSDKKEKKNIHTIQGYTPDGKPKTMQFAAKKNCDRCGECCRRDTPIILKDDMSLLIEGVISESELYTIREGEKLRSSIDGDSYYCSMEIIKVRPIFGSFTCLFYDPLEGCTIYEKRPSACRQFECWTQNYEITGLEGKRLTRKDLFGEIEILNEVFKRHEDKCSLYKFNDLIEDLKKGKEDNVSKIAEMILYDLTLRDWLKEKLTLSDEVLPLFFGRTLFEIAPFYGLIIEKEDENFVIKISQEEEE
ncbi:MAG: YkgJ family cysteine cluster protein [Thermodesulfovibrio sp.]|nr:YkgJ family cysteine cluster protein [Thermodesulfovibrio sp.]